MRQASNPQQEQPRRHVLLISPLTFNYHESIAEALHALGFEVTWWNERASSATLYKVMLRLLPALTARWSQRHFLRRLESLDASSVTHVLVIKGEGLSRRVVQEMRLRLPLASKGLYLWDGLENVPGALAIADLFDCVATFDPSDAQAQGWAYRPLFARSSSVSEAAQVPERYDWCFIGTLHSDRHKVITAARRLMAKPERSFVFGFFPSKFVRTLRYLTDPSLWRAPKESLSTVPMSRQAVEAVVSASRAVLDVEHPRQRGLTMRTIETLLAGKKLITTNRCITECNLFHPSRVAVIARDHPLVPESFLAAPFIPVPEALRFSYTCEGWVLELLAQQEESQRQRT